jgi:hypothetical protein
LHLAPKGTSPRHDEVRKLVDAKILRAISVGFMPIRSEPRLNSKNGGVRYLQMELTEASLVSVPANPSALMTCKALGISAATQRLLFKTSSLGERIRQVRRTIQKTKVAQARASTAKIRETCARSIANLEKYERELSEKFSPTSTASKIARERALKEFESQVQAVQREINSITDDFYARVAAGPWGVHAREADNIDGFTRAREQLDQRQRLGEAAKKSKTHYDWGDTSTTRWRGQKVPLKPGQTWQGKKV